MPGLASTPGGDPYAAGVGEFGCPVARLGRAVLGRLARRRTGRCSCCSRPGPCGLAGDSLAGAIAGLRVIALVGLVLIGAGLAGAGAAGRGDPARAVWLVLACPLVLIHLVSGAHNDALMIGLIVAGLALVVSRPRRGGWWLAGAVLGLAVGVKATAVVVLPFAVLSRLPASREPDTSVRSVGESRRPAVALGGVSGPGHRGAVGGFRAGLRLGGRAAAQR